MKQYKEDANYVVKNRRKYINNVINYNDFNDRKFGMYNRGALYFSNSKYLEASIDYLSNIIDNDDIIIVGGSDETDFVYDTVENHTKLPTPEDVEIYDRRKWCFQKWKLLGRLWKL